ncbi:hypothetical protein Tco_1126944, partial [Tanacetum coccineum]
MRTEPIGPRPPPINTPVDKRVGNGFCDYHGEKGHSTDECIQLKKQIEKMVRVGRLDHMIWEVQEGRDKQKPTPKKDHTEETPATRIPPNAPRHPTNFMTEEVPETNEVGNPDFSWEEFAAKYRYNLAPFITPSMGANGKRSLLSRMSFDHEQPDLFSTEEEEPSIDAQAPTGDLALAGRMQATSGPNHAGDEEVVARRTSAHERLGPHRENRNSTPYSR